MNGKTTKKIRKAINAKEREMVETVFEYFNSLPFFERVKIAVRVLRGNL